MEESDRKRFGAYIRGLRNKAGLSLRDVEREGALSNSYLNQLEHGNRNPPKPEILKKLAALYGEPFKALMAAAGWQEPDEIDLYRHNIEQAFQFVRSDPRFKFGNQAIGDELSTDAKRFIIDMYQALNPGVNLMYVIQAQTAAGEPDEELYDDAAEEDGDE